jgi:hypothetical protein
MFGIDIDGLAKILTRLDETAKGDEDIRLFEDEAAPFLKVFDLMLQRWVDVKTQGLPVDMFSRNPEEFTEVFGRAKTQFDSTKMVKLSSYDIRTLLEGYNDIADSLSKALLGMPMEQAIAKYRQMYQEKYGDGEEI